MIKVICSTVIFVKFIGFLCIIHSCDGQEARTPLCLNDSWIPLRSRKCILPVQEPATWSNASAICHSFSSHLMIFEDRFIESTINISITDVGFWGNFSIIFSSIVLRGQWVGMRSVNEKLWWEYDVPMKVKGNHTSSAYNWSSGQPDRHRGECGYIWEYSSATYTSNYVLELSLESCDMKHPFLCVRDSIPTSLMTSTIPTLCPSGWTGHLDSDHCYIVNTDLLGFEQAQLACEGMRGTLVQPSTDLEIQFMLAQTRQFQYSFLWVGLYDNYTTVDGEYWGTNEPLKSLVFVPVRRRRQSAVVQCYALDGQMYRQECNTSLASICQMPSLAPALPTVELDNVSSSMTISRDQLGQFTLTCNASNYNADKPVVWVKDGIYFGNGVAPNGLRLTIGDVYMTSQLDVYRTSIQGLLQGYYRCEVWGFRTDRISSPDTLVTFEDVATFRANIYTPSVPFLQSSLPLAAETFWTSDVYTQLNSTLYTRIFSDYDNIQLHFDGIVDTNNINITVYYLYNFNNTWMANLSNYFSPSPNDGPEPGSVPPPPPPGPLFPNATWQWYFNEKILQSLYKSAKDAVPPAVTTTTSAPAYPTSAYPTPAYPTPAYPTPAYPVVTISSVELRRTDGCATNNSEFHFLPNVFGSIEGSTELCFPPDMKHPVPQVVGTCFGNFTSGGRWGITAATDCGNIPGVYSVDLLTLSQTTITPVNVGDIAGNVSILTFNATSLTPTDIYLVSVILNNVAMTPELSHSVATNFVETVDHVMNVDQGTLTEAQNFGNAPIRITMSLDMMTSHVDLNDWSNFTLTAQENIAVQIGVIDERNFPIIGFGLRNGDYYPLYDRADLIPPGWDTAIVLSHEALNLFSAIRNIYDNNLRSSFVIYSGGQLFTDPSYFVSNAGKRYKDLENSTTNSRVVSGSISGIPIQRLSEPIEMVFRLKKKTQLRQSCAYVEYGRGGEDGGWGWSAQGLNNYTEHMTVTCYSTHLTNFAVLAGFDDSNDSVIGRSLQIISIVGLAISIAGLSITLVSQVLFKERRKSRSQKVIFNLALSLLAVDIIVLAGVDQTSNYGGCCAVAALLHYFLLVSFLWMLVTAILQYLKFVKVFDTHTSHFMIKTAIPAWLLPAVIVGIVAIVDYRLFRGPEHFCWLAPGAFHFAFLLPLGLIMVTNLVLFVLIIRGITCNRASGLQTNQPKRKLAWLQVQAAMCCFVVMGLTWLFAFFAIDGAAIVMQFLFCIFNAFQGFFIFLFVCVHDKQFRKSCSKLCSRCCRNNVRLPSRQQKLAVQRQMSEGLVNKSTEDILHETERVTDDNSTRSSSSKEAANHTTSTFEEIAMDDPKTETEFKDLKSLKTELEIERCTSVISP